MPDRKIRRRAAVKAALLALFVVLATVVFHFTPIKAYLTPENLSN